MEVKPQNEVPRIRAAARHTCWHSLVVGPSSADSANSSHRSLSSDVTNAKGIARIKAIME